MDEKSLLLQYTESTKHSCTFLLIGIVSITLYLVTSDKMPYIIDMIGKLAILAVLSYTIFIIVYGTYPIIKELKMDILETKHVYIQRTIIQNVLLVFSIMALMYYFI
jgi:hypothetical protein